jgi:hypothetical protein
VIEPDSRLSTRSACRSSRLVARSDLVGGLEQGEHRRHDQQEDHGRHQLLDQREAVLLIGDPPQAPAKHGRSIGRSGRDLSRGGAERPEVVPRKEAGPKARLSLLQVAVNYQPVVLGQPPEPCVVQVRVGAPPLVLVIVKSLVDFE